MHFFITTFNQNECIKLKLLLEKSYFIIIFMSVWKLLRNAVISMTQSPNMSSSE